ncbi:uncharacterized protein LTR77_007729 [Saxophila tyrrhenica]|uniref:Uncharacterized protein n=1 Tax=Saxophila tyrrhenica TaxID=1690608 RepID=A0AAV9P6Q8_9PEZI|nr:hypothetical protein LTR77_007729 [Saxophila tyrrhenica]
MPVTLLNSMLFLATLHSALANPEPAEAKHALYPRSWPVYSYSADVNSIYIGGDVSSYVPSASSVVGGSYDPSVVPSAALSEVVGASSAVGGQVYSSSMPGLSSMAAGVTGSASAGPAPTPRPSGGSGGGGDDGGQNPRPAQQQQQQANSNDASTSGVPSPADLNGASPLPPLGVGSMVVLGALVGVVAVAL